MTCVTRPLLPAIILGLVLTCTGHSQGPALEAIQWQQGPSTADLGRIAKLYIPNEYLFADGVDTRVLMEAMENPPSGNELGFVAPTDFSWYVVFEFRDIGYVPDDEKESLDASAILASIKRATDKANEERRRRGWAALHIIGWQQEPRYDEATHNLEWAVKGESDGELVINYNTRLLGRHGVMSATLVTDPSTLPQTLPRFKRLLKGFEFQAGQRYTEFRPGDKVAKYGLTALIVGGATAAATKTGLFKWLWKALLAVLVGLLSLLKRLFSRRHSD